MDFPFGKPQELGRTGEAHLNSAILQQTNCCSYVLYSGIGTGTLALLATLALCDAFLPDVFLFSDVSDVSDVFDVFLHAAVHRLLYTRPGASSSAILIPARMGLIATELSASASSS